MGWLGLLLVAVFWPLNWLLPGLRTSYLFFPLWLGYILCVDELVWQRRGTSLLRRSWLGFVGLFLVSAPAWWLFEWINRRTQNWIYLGGDSFSGLEYVILSSISFSTVMPAVFETAELVRSWGWVERLEPGPRVTGRGWSLGAWFAGGWLMAALVMVWPRTCYPLVWLAVVLILAPLNRWLGRTTLWDWLEKGDWRPAVSLALGALICGFFWELWNYYSYPKWIYRTPGAQFLHLFEMPLLGYGGYLFFAWELHELRGFLWPRSARLRL